MLLLIQKNKSMLEKFKTQIIENPQTIQGGAADSEDFIITDDLDGA
ncbi:MAG: hypothetical protein AB8B65_19505 [Kordia sp.]